MIQTLTYLHKGRDMTEGVIQREIVEQKPRNHPGTILTQIFPHLDANIQSKKVVVMPDRLTQEGPTQICPHHGKDMTDGVIHRVTDHLPEDKRDMIQMRTSPHPEEGNLNRTTKVAAAPEDLEQEALTQISRLSGETIQDKLHLGHARLSKSVIRHRGEGMLMQRED